jgi:nitrogen fixation protein FixH
MHNASPAPRPFTGTHMLLILVAFFATVIGVNLLMAYLANSTWSGLVVENGYVASQSFNADAARLRAQAALGWKVSLVHQHGEVSVTFDGPQGKAITGLAVTGSLDRPTTDRQDQVLAFHEAEPGRYVASADLSPGIWDIDVAASGATETPYIKSFRFIAK